MISTSLLARGAVLAALFCVGAAASSAFTSTREDGQNWAVHKQSDQFPNVVLTTQHGKPVRFHDDVVKDRVVIVNLMYSGCGDTCPANTAELAKLNDILGERMGRDIIMVSISIDPIADTPERLKKYWEAFGAKPGWVFLTGKAADIDRLRRELGAYDLDPAIDADPTQHAAYIIVGNDRSDRWSALPLLMERSQLVGTILRIARSG